MSTSTRLAHSALAVLWAGWMLVLGLGDPRQVPGLDADIGETVQHLIAFTVLAALVMSVLRARRTVILGFVGMVGLGIVGELLQLTTSNRQFEVIDILADFGGVTLGTAVVRWFPGRVTQAGLLIVTVTLMIVLPLAPEAVPRVPLTYPEDCVDPPQAAVILPEVLLDEPELAAAELPVEILEPRVADLRRELLATNEITVESWFETNDLNQSGPVRIFTISDGTREDQVNVHLGIEGDDVSVRLRTSCNIFKWVGATDVIVADIPQHVVFTWRGGRLAIWVNGVVASVTNNRFGDFARWDPNFHIVVGDEHGGGRRFDGTVFSVTIWNAALTDDTIMERSTIVPRS